MKDDPLDRFDSVDPIFEKVLELSPDQRAAYLDEACGGDQELREAVERLLRLSEAEGDPLVTDCRFYGLEDEEDEEEAGTAIQVERPSGAGTVLGPYQVIALLGEGGMGQVYKARDTRLHRDVALKVLDESLRGKSQLERFGREARAASALNHPNIATIYDIGSDAGVSYIAMEYVEGESLRERLARAPLELDETMVLAEQIADGLAAAHAKGIVHRDLKPANVMISAAGVPKIVDFGLAKMDPTERDSTLAADPLTAEGAIFGTVGYMSPEQARGKKIDYRSDLFSFGALLYEMLTGSRAFQRGTDLDVLAAILNETPEPVAHLNPTVPQPLCWAVERCLQKETEERYESTKDLARDLRALRQQRKQSDSTKVTCGCGEDNAPGHRFCGQCGAALRKACRSCGVELLVDALFCGSCGQSAEKEGAESTAESFDARSSSMAGERRQVTVLVIRLMDYEALIDKELPADVDEASRQFEELVGKVIKRFEGVIESAAPEEITALFGIPVAHEDDALRAVRSAIQIQEQASRLQLSSAIHTGFVVVRESDGRGRPRRVVGEAAGVARNLAMTGRSGDIQLSPESRRLTANAIRTEPLEPVRLRADGETVVPHRVIDGGDPSMPTLESSESPFTVFAGRQGELGTLIGYVEAAIGGEGQSVAVVGEAGVGKSRLLYELRRQLDPDRATLVEGRCQSHADRVPYLPLIHASRALLGVRGEDAIDVQLEAAVSGVLGIDRDLESLLPLYMQLLSIPSEEYKLPEHLEGKSFRHAMQDALAALFTLASQTKPIVLVLEDWHWVDEASHAAVRQIIEICPSYPLVVVISRRPESEFELGAPDHLRTIHLGALGRVSSSTIIHSVLGAAEVPDRLIRMIHDRTGGNPFFLEEVCHILQEEGTVRIQDGKAVVPGEMAGIQLPESVQAVIRARLDRIEPGAFDLLRRAAVIGREFSMTVLNRVVDDAEDLEETLATLKERGIVRQLRVFPDPVYSFQHVLTQEVAYDSLLQRQKKELHGRVGEALEQLHGARRAEHYDALARHFAEAEDWRKAVRYGLRGADRARNLSQFADALTALEHTRTWLERLPEDAETRERRIALLQEEARVCEVVGDRQRQQRAIDDLLELLANEADRKERARAFLGRAELMALDKNFSEAERALQEALAISRRLNDDDLERDALRSMAFVQWQSHRNEEALLTLDQCIEMDRGQADKTRIVGDLTNRASVLRALGQYDEALTVLDEALHYCDTTDCNPHRHVEALYVRHTIHRDLGRTADGERDLRDAIAVQSQDKFTIHQPFHTSALATMLIERGEVDEALGLLRSSVERSRQSRYAFGLSQCQRNLAQALHGLGREEEALPHMLEAAEIFKRLRDTEEECQMLASAAPILERRGRQGEARSCWKRVVEGTSQPAPQVMALRGLARIAEAQGDDARALAYLRRGLAICKTPKSSRRAEMHNAVGILEWKRGQFEAALEHYDRARVIFEERADDYHLGLTLNSIGATLKAMGRTDDAVKTLEQSLDVHERSADELLSGHAQALLGDIALESGNAEEARAHYESSLRLRLRVGDRRGEGWMRCKLAQVLRAESDPTGADAHLALATSIAEEVDDGELANACVKLDTEER